MAKGPFSDLAEYCQRDGGKTAIGKFECRVRTRDGAANKTINRIGTVQVIEVGDSIGAAIGLGITTPAGYYVVEQLALEDFNGGDWDDLLQRTTLHSTSPGTLTVKFQFQSIETLWVDEGKPRPDQPTKVSETYLEIKCALDSDERLSCLLAEG